MEQITKKAFIDLLSKNRTILLGSIGNKRHPLHDLISDAVKNFKPVPNDDRRTVKKVQSNAIQFSDNSWLYFDGAGEKTYHRIGNVIYQHTKIDYSKDNSCSWDDVLYSAVVYYVEHEK